MQHFRGERSLEDQFDTNVLSLTFGIAGYAISRKQSQFLLPAKPEGQYVTVTNGGWGERAQTNSGQNLTRMANGGQFGHA